MKLVFLGSALAMTIYGIYLMRSDYGSKTFEAFGFGLQSENFVAWCQTRVKKIEVSRGEVVYLLHEENRKWWVQESRDGQLSSPKELDYIAVEKWLAEFCQVKTEKNLTPQEAMALPVSPIMNIELINGEKKTLFRIGETDLQIKGRAFASEEMEKGLLELYRLLAIRP